MPCNLGLVKAMYGSAIPRVMGKHPGPQPPLKISHYDYAGVAGKLNAEEVKVKSS